MLSYGHRSFCTIGVCHGQMIPPPIPFVKRNCQLSKKLSTTSPSKSYYINRNSGAERNFYDNSTQTKPHKPNLILEALAYLGRRASNKTWDQMEQRIQQRKVLPSPALCQALELLKALTHQLDREEVVWGIASIFEDDLPNQHRMDTQVFTDLVLGLNAPDSTKVALLELSRNHRAVGARALACLRPIVAHLEEHQAQLEELAAPYLQQCAPLSQLEFFTQLSHLRPAPETTYTLHPFLFGADTNLTFDEAPGQVRIYGGVLRRELMELVSGRTSAQDQVCETYRLLGDSTRFDILCYLRGRTAYVQELSTRFSLSRNTIHHHMNKLSDCGLVQCTIHGNRTFYTLDEEQVQLFLERQAALFGKN